jgi:hypothetical protein
LRGKVLQERGHTDRALHKRTQRTAKAVAFVIQEASAAFLTIWGMHRTLAAFATAGFGFVRRIAFVG